LNRSTIVIALVLLSPFSVLLQGQPDVLAALVSSTTTQTVTSYITLTGTGQTTHYVTFREVSSVQTVTATTYTTKGVTKVLIQILTTVRIPTTITVIFPSLATHTGYISKTEYVVGYTQLTVYGTVTSQYVTNLPTTMFSTSASTATYSTSQTVSITATQTLTSVSEQSFSETLSQNWWITLVLGAAVLLVLVFTLARRRRRVETLRCMSCGAENPATNEFCAKCGSKLRTPTG
jgi:ribosomal protein L40E